MSFSEPRARLIAYDITDPRRLRLVHRFLKSRAIPVQYSVFAGVLSERQLASLLRGLERLIDPSTDDVRIYPIPQRGLAVTLGRQLLPEGVLLAEMRLVPVISGRESRAAAAGVTLSGV